MIAKIHSGSLISALSACLIVAFASACGPEFVPPDNQDAAKYFGLSDNASFEFVGPGGITEVHNYSFRESQAEGDVYLRVVTRNGFVQDDASMSFRAGTDGLFATGFFDCAIMCATADEPFKIFDFPIAAGDANESESRVVIREDDLTVERQETHRFQAGLEETITVPAGEYEGFRVAWTRSLDEEIESLSFSFVPEVGIIESTGPDGVAFQLSVAP